MIWKGKDMWDLNESSSFEEWLAALCKIDDITDFQKKNPDLLKKCPEKLRRFGYPQYGPIRANAIFWMELCDDKPELYEYFDWKEGLKQLEKLAAKCNASQSEQEDMAALDFLFHIFRIGFSNKAFSCSQRQWTDLEKRVRKAAQEYAFCGMSETVFWLTSKDYLEYYTRNDVEFDWCCVDKPCDCVKVLSEEDWRTLLERKPDFCTKNNLSPDELAEEAASSQDLTLLKCAAGMGADLCSLEVLSEAFFPDDGGISMPIVSYLIEEKKIHEKMNNSPDEEKRSWFLSCIQALVQEGETDAAKYLISQAGNLKDAVQAGLTGALQGLQEKTFFDLWNEYRDTMEGDQEFLSEIAGHILMSRTDNSTIWNLLHLMNVISFDIDNKTVRAGLTNVLKATHDLFRDLNDEVLAENAGPVEIAQAIVRDAEMLTTELK